MTIRLSENIGDLTPSATLAIAAKAKEMINRGEDVIDLSAGQPDFPTPPFICEAARKAMEKGETGYTPAAGIPPLRKAIARKLREENGLSYAPEQVIVTAGVKQAIFNALFCLFGRGDEIIVPSPYWVSYPALVSFAGATVRCLETSKETGFHITASNLEKAVTKRTRGLILNSPNNPTGSVYPMEELLEIWEFCRDRSIWIISDEIYEKIIYGGMPFVSPAAVSSDAPRNVVVMNGFSKAFSMMGWRVGYAAGPLELIRAMESLQSHTTSNTCSISQWGALAAMEEKERSREVHREMLEEFTKRRDFILELAQKEPALSFIDPQGAFYLFFETAGYYGSRLGDHEVKDSVSLCRYLLEEEGLALVPGEAFGRDDYTRISYAAPLSAIKGGMDRLKRGLNALRSSGKPIPK